MPKVIPFGDRILCKRRKVGEKIGKEGVLFAPDTVSEHDTDLADVVYVPDLTFADEEIIHNAPHIIKALSLKAQSGDAEAFNALLKLNLFLKLKSIKESDSVMIGRYVGTSFNTSDSTEELVLILADDVIGLVVKDE